MLDTALLINLLGFSVGIALYALMLVMVVRHRPAGRPHGIDRLLLATACLGLVWNLGEFVVFVLKDFQGAAVPAWLLAGSYSALGFLPSVVVHSTWQSEENTRPSLFYPTVTAYLLSTCAAALNVIAAANGNGVPSRTSLRLLTFGAIALLVALFVLAFRQALERKAVWITALLVFAVSTLHLSAHDDRSSWPVELVAHQSSLPLALAILIQDYRFAFADLFLKRALSLMLLALFAFGLYVFAAVPLLAWHETHDKNDVQAAVIVLGLWITTALVYPKLHRFAEWFVDAAILRRTDFERLKASIAEAVERAEDDSSALDAACSLLRAALGSEHAEWRSVGASSDLLPSVRLETLRTTVLVPTIGSPFFEFELLRLAGGRDLLSGEIQMLESAALIVARRIDAIRATRERIESGLREQEFSKLAAEAQLSALRAQVNPHFLFNALTTIGYLIQSAPDKALDTLLRLTRLLRGVLRSTGEFSSLSDEIGLIENYIEIEKARFEDRLKVTIDVPTEVRTFRIPSLILQPLVENAVKHGISENKKGGTVAISASVEKTATRSALVVRVSDSGCGHAPDGFEREGGVGLRNIRQRLERHYGGDASLTMTGDESGTVAELRIPSAARSTAASRKN